VATSLVHHGYVTVEELVPAMRQAFTVLSANLLVILKGCCGSVLYNYNLSHQFLEKKCSQEVTEEDLEASVEVAVEVHQMAIVSFSKPMLIMVLCLAPPSRDIFLHDCVQYLCPSHLSCVEILFYFLSEDIELNCSIFCDITQCSPL
jgi:hypothetical protein